MTINFKYRRPFYRSARQVLLFVLSCGYLVGCFALELEPLTYQEALTRYQETDGIENYRCALVPADDHYRPRPCKNAANDGHQLPGIFSASRRPSEAQSGAIDNSGCYGTFGFSTPAGGRYES